MKTIFFVGKGGVGKTTLSAVSAAYLSKEYRVAIFSLDQAHNLGDVFDRKLNDKQTKINENLYAAEINLQKWRTRYINDIKKSAAKSFSFLTSYNLTSWFELYEYAPDIEELAMILAINELIRNEKFNAVIFDMPPTALTFSFLNSIKRNIIWLEKLIKLRKLILSKKQIITRIEIGRKVIETDKVLSKLIELKEFYLNFKQCILSSLFIIITNPDTTSRLETQRIINFFEQWGLTNYRSVINKTNSCDQSDFCFPFVKNNEIFNLTKIENKFLSWLLNYI